ncbi:DNA topoisomerase III [Thalassotalea profundi]|uniref:DNA topoisomerase 3 n=1 Tax=Thalassotalea profundi TaxID=2036687 RepID=A0ABQ3J329_9GAMM|nr:DNA topoisomerase III [Thalassotalea profundi]GHF00896.1 DNA topoisomerase 3 [Thalassotalea profundi]
MNLYIAEKPSLGRAIADALPKPHKKQQGYIEVGNGDVVTWCIGHILEQVEPDAYDIKFKKWRLEHLPIIPQQWLLKPKFKTKSQLAVIRALVKKASRLIHAGDPDREGQLLVDEVIDYLKVSDAKKKNTQRLLVSDLNVSAVKRALTQLKSNQEFIPLSVSALARSRADWLYGINLTRAYTIQGGKVGYQGVLSVGRVQTPILGLVVARDLEIQNFVAKPFYQVSADIITPNSEKFSALWKPSEACQPYMDEEGRVVVKNLAENVIGRITDQPALVNQVKNEDKKQQPPLPFNLSALQIEAAKRFSMNTKLVLDVCQSLYEKHKLITYPRSDCRYLPKEQHNQATTVIAHIANSASPLAEAAKNADAKLKSFAWNDKKITAHHAIIPTEKSAANINLNNFESNIYQLITRQYLAQFYPVYRYAHRKISLTIAGGLFTASANVPTQIGWKCLFKSTTVNTNKVQEGDEQTNLPNVQQGDTLHCLKGNLLDKLTQCPAAFTDATLLAAMTGINRFVTDKALKAVLKDTDGLGTEATRAGIIDLLFKRGYLKRQGKKIHATDVGKGLINALPEQCTKPDMTAHWEATLNAIGERNASYQEFITPLNNTITQLIANASSQLPTSLQGLKSTQKPAYKKRWKAKKSASNTAL